jgi:hypothetical protein
LRLDERNQVGVNGYILTSDEKLGIVIDKDGEKNGKGPNDPAINPRQPFLARHPLFLLLNLLGVDLDLSLDLRFL